MNGFPQPANWVMMSKKNGRLVTLAFQRADHIIRNTPDMLKKNYHCLGKTLLFSTIRYIQKTNPFWKYYHVSSKCVERNSKGQKLTNAVLLSDVEIDPVCENRYVFVPCYNTAPSFPDWFLKIDNKRSILTLHSLMSRLFLKSLDIKL